MDGVLNYPLYFAIQNVFKGGSFTNTLVPTISSLESVMGSNLDYWGVFVDNHDNARFLHNYGNKNNLKSALCFSLFFRGIPIVYYGDEQGYGGGNDPNNR